MTDPWVEFDPDNPPADRTLAHLPFGNCQSIYAFLPAFAGTPPKWDLAVRRDRDAPDPVWADSCLYAPISPPPPPVKVVHVMDLPLDPEGWCSQRRPPVDQKVVGEWFTRDEGYARAVVRINKHGECYSDLDPLGGRNPDRWQPIPSGYGVRSGDDVIVGRT